MMDNKPWWASRTIWAALIAALTPILASLHILPSWFTADSLDLVLTVVSAGSAIMFRVKATTVIKAPVAAPAA